MSDYSALIAHARDQVDTALGPESGPVTRPAAKRDGDGIAGRIDHTLLHADATQAEIEELCDEAVGHGFASVCVNSRWVPTAAESLAGTEVMVCTVVGFPLGAMTRLAKAEEARITVAEGAQEVDMVLDVGGVLSGDLAGAYEDIRGVVAAASVPVKVILETCLLTDEQKAIACLLAVRAGAAYVKMPVVKGVGSERSYEMLAVGLQTFGGSGFLQDYPLEQYIRDAKIDTLYEGTTAIQGLDFFFRKMVKDQFKAIFHLAAQITETVKGDEGSGQLAAERELLGKALEDVQGIVGVMGQWAMASQQDSREIYKVGLNSTRLLMASGDLIIGWLLLRQAEVASQALAAGPSERDRVFYEGKVETARWFARNRLPLLAAERAVAEATTLDIMDLPEEAF